MPVRFNTLSSAAPVLGDKLLGTDVSDTADDANGGSANFTLTSIRALLVLNDPYGAGWTGDLSAPTRGAVWTKIEALDAAKAAAGHSHTKADVGLGNVDNTSDANKPISAATQTALDAKAAAGHSHTKADVGLGNVDNTSDANKPISAATQTALDAKANLLATDVTVSASRNLLASDIGKTLVSSGAANIVITIPTGLLLNGQSVEFRWRGTGTFGVVAGSGFTLNKEASFSTQLAERYAVAVLRAFSSTEADLNGSLGAA